MQNEVFTIENEALRVTVSSYGAEVVSILDKETEAELLKAPGGTYWEETSPILFPICGRLYGGETVVDGRVYRMEAHGFARTAEFSVMERVLDKISLCFSGNEEILSRQYPFMFSLTVTYALCGRSLETYATVENCGDGEMPFSIGFHPGFRIPLNGKGTLEDHYLEFEPPCRPEAWVISADAYLKRETHPFSLTDDRILPLSNELFRIDGVFLERSGSSVTLRSRAATGAIRIDYAGFPYLGIWRPYAEDADFLCIEPWQGSPDYDGERTELRDKRDMTLLCPEEKKAVSYRITVL